MTHKLHKENAKEEVMCNIEKKCYLDLFSGTFSITIIN